jgi:formate/nitrite transporter FocA (FNT family)
METLRKSAAAGMMICIGAAIYLVNENKVIGAFMFSIGLFTICFFGMFLFTGKIGYVIDNRNKPNCALIWLGNLIGGTVSALLIRFAKPQLFETASQLMEKKFSQNPLATMVLSFFCGVLMYVAVENYRSNKNDVAKIVGIFLCVPPLSSRALSTASPICAMPLSGYPPFRTLSTVSGISYSYRYSTVSALWR